VDSMIVDSGTVSSAISSCLPNCLIKTKAVATAVSGHSVIVKEDLAAFDERSGTGGGRSRKKPPSTFPFDLADVSLDYQICRRKAGSPQMDVLLVAVKEGQDSELHQRTLDVGTHPRYCGHRCAGFAELLRVQLPAGAGTGGGAAQPGRQRV